MFNSMDYRKAQQEIEQRRLELRNKQREISLKQRQLEQEMSAVDKELLGLNQMQTGAEIALGRMQGKAPAPPSLTKHVRHLLASTQGPLTTGQIRDSCEAVGIKAKSRRLLLVAVHTTLKRMNSHLRTTRVDGRLAYLARPSLLDFLAEREGDENR